MTKKLVWRLNQLPTTNDIKNLIESGVITKLEAKDVFFREEEEKKVDRDELKELKDEVKLLREVVMSLANIYPRITYPIIVKKIEPITNIPWTEPWITWCNSSNNTYHLES